MGKNKISRFAENLTFRNTVQPDFDEIFHKDYKLKGSWKKEFFGNDRPIILELGCGRGEYTVALGGVNSDKNYIGIDIKGARLWRGAKSATEMGMMNVGFLRTRIEFINSFFSEFEISEIWVTFPDPQLKKGREKKRLTSPVFLDYYAKFLAPGGVIHLKTDSQELHEYTKRVIDVNQLPVDISCNDIYGTGFVDATLSIKTAYESRFLEEGKPITYLKFGLGDRTNFEMVYDNTED